MKSRIISWTLVLCMALALLSVSAFATKSDQDIAYAVTGGNIYFRAASGRITDSDRWITEAAIPSEIDGVPVTRISDYTFRYCDSLTSVTIPGSVTSLGNSSFYGCVSLADVTIPNSVTSLESCVFQNCSKLQRVTIGSGVAAIGEYDFKNCSSLTDVTILKGAAIISSYAFSHCSSLPSITLPDSIATIDNYAFESCGSLKDITIPDSVTTVSRCAFEGCSSLEDVYYGGTEEQWNAITIRDGNAPLRNATIHFAVPPEHTDSYATKVTAPTCTEKGYTTHIFGDGSRYVDSYVDALGHAWNNGIVTAAPTETADGVKIFTCARCGETKTEVIPATGVKPVDPTTVFTDVTRSWAYDGIAYCYNHGLIAGMTDTTFEPDGTLTRGQLVTILWRQAKEPKATKACAFTDLTMNYYKNAIAWAAENGIVAGLDATHFDPDSPISRQDTAAILYRYAKDYLKLDVSGAADITGFPDYSRVSNYAKEAMAWANAAGIISGTTSGKSVILDPKGNATRAQAARILMVFCEDVL